MISRQASLFPGKSEAPRGTGSLADEFLLPPFSVLSSRWGWWQERKASWIALGIKSEEGRGRVGEQQSAASTRYKSDGFLGQSDPGASVFDPVLTEALVRWFIPVGGSILDPFAGGSVRGIVAAMLGRRYVGVELRGEQVAANRKQARAIFGVGSDDITPVSRDGDNVPKWLEGDARGCHRIPTLFDGLLTCPPYGDLEVYSDDERDLSNMSAEDFELEYRKAIAAACSRVREDRFLSIVVGDYRRKDGTLSGFPAQTVEAFEAAGCKYYNDMVFVTPCGSLPVRIGRQFRAGRKIGKTHQNVLVFVKGDPFKASAAAAAGGEDKP
jgi:hypothetical protein